MSVRHTNGEIQQRVDKCFELRFNSTPGMSHTQWIDYCHREYNDRSEQTYTDYWMKSSKKYEEIWREKLNKQLDPAINKLFELLASEDEKVAQRAVDQILKYTGNDIQKMEVEGNINFFKAKFTDDGDDS